MKQHEISSQLRKLASLYGVQTSYFGVGHRRMQVSAESVLGVLKALGAPVEAAEKDIPAAIRERILVQRRRLVEPVTVVWEGAIPSISITCPASLSSSPLDCSLVLESGEVTTWRTNLDNFTTLESVDVEGSRFVTRGVVVPKTLPLGYHTLSIQIKDNSCETLLIVAPQKTYPGDGEKRWGAFIPLYALQGKNSWSSGDYSALGELGDMVAEKRGSVIATLPLLPLFLYEPFEPGPYDAVSRLFWNEFYVDVAAVRELRDCPAAQTLLASASFRQEIEKVRRNPMVDYCGIMSLKRRVMEELCRCVLNNPNVGRDEFEKFIRANPLVEKYAAFRAVMEKRRTLWTHWPQSLREGKITPADYDKNVKDYYLYAQWLAHWQVKELSENARQKGIQMYFDLPLGVHADGFDTWQHGGIFALAAAGAPPDAVFTGGQNWLFPPLHPEKIRQDGYRYFRDYLCHTLQYADILRIDHIMGLHRLFWIPQGADASRGTYVRYRADEFYAIVCLESHRHKSVIVGEDLGIVPGYVRKAMAHHGLSRMYVLYYELADDSSRALRDIRPRTVASLNTHDMAPFAAFWQGNDIDERLRLGLVDAKGAVKERENRQKVKNTLVTYLRNKKFLGKAVSALDALKACLSYLSASRAHTVLVNLEDLWLETRSQNVPGVGDKFPSWRRKASHTLDEFGHIKSAGDTLAMVSKYRKAGKEG